MGIKFIYGDTFKQEFDGVMAELKRNYFSDKRSMHVVLVPDKFSLTMEKEVLESLDISGSARLSVLSFLRFARQSMKNKIKNCLTPQGVVMLLQKVINDVRPSLTVYKNASKTPNFANEMYASLTSLRNSGVSAQNLKDALPRIKSAVLRDKVSDMAVILEAYLTELQKGFADSTTRLEKFVEHIPTLANVEKTHFYVTDIYKFTAPEYDILDALSKCAASLTIGMPLGFGENKRLFPHNVKAHLAAMAKDSGVLFEQKRADGGVKPQFEFVVNNLYSYKNMLPKTADGAIELCYADDEFLECEEVASKIVELVTFGGYRYKDVAVVTPSEEYSGPIKAALERFEIPHYIDEKFVLTGLLPVKYLLAVLDYASSQRTDDALEVVKSPMFTEGEDFTFKDVCAFENDLLPLGAERMSFAKSFSQNEKTEQVRLAFLRRMPRFKRSDTAENYVSAIEKFLEIDGFFEKISSFSSSQNAKIQKSFSQIESRLISVFDEIRRAIGKSFMDFDDFCRILSSTLESIKISLTPLYLDSVFVGSAKESRFEGVKTMFVVGATAAAMPEGVGNPAIISADDEGLLLEAGISVSPTKVDDVLSNMFYLTELVVRPTEKLVVSYPKTIAGAAVQPSTLIEQLQSLFNDVKVEKPRFSSLRYSSDVPAEVLAKEYGLKFGSRRNAFYSILGGVYEETASARAKQPYDAAYALLNSDEKTAVDNRFSSQEETDISDGADLFLKDFSTGDYVVSVSQLEKYFACPLQNYFAYGLRLQKRLTDVIENSLTGSFVHEVLEKYFGLFASGKETVENVTEERTKSLVSEIVVKVSEEKKFEIFKNSDKHKKSFSRLKTDCVKICVALTDSLKNSSYRPYKLEASFWNNADNTRKNAYKPIRFSIDGREVFLRGKIDRIDVFENRFYIIDYKSYGKDLKPKDVFFGTAIQLVAYMTAISKQEKMVPSGVFYLPVTVGYKSKTSDTEKRFRANGFFDKSFKSLCEFENSFKDLGIDEEKSGKFLKPSVKAKPYSDNKAGEKVNLPNKVTGGIEEALVTLSSSAGAVTAEELSDMGGYVQKLVEVALKEISDGYVEARPVEDSCSRCDYKDICPKKTDEGRRKPNVEIKDFTLVTEE